MENNTKNQADDDRMFDELFRENLSDHKIEPSSWVWKGISRRLMWGEISHFNFTNFSGLSWIVGASVVVIIAISSYLLTRPEVPSYSASESFKENAPVATSQGTGFTSPVSVPTEKYVSKINTSAPPPASLSTNPSMKTVAAAMPSSSISKVEASLKPELTTNEPTDPDHFGSDSPEITETTFLTFLSSQPGPDLTEGVLKDTLRLQIPGNSVTLILRDKIPTPKFFSASLAVLPEFSYYNNGNSYSEMNYWLNAGASYNISRFSVGTGLSLGYVYDEGMYRIDYRSKDSVGYYESVVGFTVDPLNPNELIYTTELKNVYDSIQHVADDQTRNRYTYIQVPLLLGYRFIETQHLGITVLTGPALSFLIARKEAKPYIDYPNARIIRIEDNSPNRISTSWQFWLSVRVDYRINKMISIFAEPSYKYTFKAFETQGEGTILNTNSIGLGIGLQFNFGKITR